MLEIWPKITKPHIKISSLKIKFHAFFVGQG